jgi:hypothetical protein
MGLKVSQLEYLGLIEGVGEDRSRTEIVDNFRRVTEALAL